MQARTTDDPELEIVPLMARKEESDDQRMEVIETFFATLPQDSFTSEGEAMILGLPWQ